MIITCIIVTKDRPEDCLRCLTSLREQKRLADQIIVIEGGQTKLKQTTGIDFSFFVPGITKQRNFARKKVRKDCDVVVYLDDDTILAPETLELVEKNFQNNPNLVGLTGKIAGEAPHSFFKKFFGKFFGLYSNKPYSIAFGLFNIINNPTERQKIEWLPGAFMCYRWEKIKNLEFDEWFSEYGLGEDFDFSLRVAQAGELWVDPNIKVEHRHSTIGRNWQKFGYMRIINRQYIYTKFFKGKYWFWLGMWWANIWLIIINAMRGLRRDRYMKEWLGEVKGVFSGKY